MNFVVPVLSDGCWLHRRPVIIGSILALETKPVSKDRRGMMSRSLFAVNDGGDSERFDNDYNGNANDHSINADKETA